MATVIDTLILQLGLDANPLVRGQKDAARALRGTRDEMDKARKAGDAFGRQVGNAFGDLTKQALAFFAVLAGARSMKDFIASAVQSNSALGRLSTNVGASTQTIQAWGKAAERVGGSADATTQSFERMDTALYDLKTNGKALPTEIYRLVGMVGMTVDTERGPAKAMEDIAAAAAKLAKVDPTRAYGLLKGSGLFDEGTINLMLRQGAAIKTVVDRMREFGASDGAIKGAERLQEAWVSLTQNVQAFAMKIAEQVMPILERMTTQFTEWVRTVNIDEVVGGVRNALGELETWFKSVDWSDAGRSLKSGLGDAADIIKQIASALKAVKEFVGSSETSGPSGSRTNPIIGRDKAKDGEWYQDGSTGFFASPAVRKGTIGDTLFGGLSGKRASGGPVSRGRTYLVGERGPELFTPGAAGGITANNRLASLGDGGMQVGGRDVSKSNPLPVLLMDAANGLSSIASTAASLLGQKGGDGAAGGAGGGRTGLRRNRVTGALELGSGAGARVARGTLAKNQQEAYQAARAEGLSDAAARALVANMSGEALGNPGSYNRDTNSRGQFVHMASGIVQWDPSRSAAIKRQFGKMPHEMSVADQTRAAIWEMKNNKRFAKTWGALNGGGSAESMVDTLVRNYEAPAFPDRDVQRRIGHLRGLKVGGPNAPAAGAGLSTLRESTLINNNRNSRSVSIGKVSVNTQATDAQGVASGLRDAIDMQMLAMLGNTGQA